MPATTPVSADSGSERRSYADERAEREDGEHEPVEHLPVQVHVVPDHVRMERRDERGDEPDAGRPQSRADLEDDQRRRDGDDDLRDPHGEPRAPEREVEAREEPAVERLGVRRRHVREESERAVVDERRREAVALVHELLEDRLALAREHQQPRQRRCDHDDEGARRPFHLASSTMGATSRERYAVVSCHVERPLDDAVWARFVALQRRRPGGFAIAALMRPADPAFGEDETLWLERAREAASLGPLGHHTHWTAPDHARPTNEDTGERVLAEGTRLRELGLTPTLFCGGGWYTDDEVAEACAELGYVDCTPRARRPPYLAQGERWASLAAPAVVELPSGRPLARDSDDALARRPRARASSPRSAGAASTCTSTTPICSTARRRALLRVALPALARRAQVTDLDALAARIARVLAARGVGRRGAALTSTGCRAPRSLRRPRCHVGRRRRPTRIATSGRRASTCSREARSLSRSPAQRFGRRARRPRRRRPRPRDLPRARHPPGRRR